MTNTKKATYILEVEIDNDENLDEFENLLTDFLENCDFKVSLNNSTEIVLDKV